MVTLIISKIHLKSNDRKADKRVKEIHFCKNKLLLLYLCKGIINRNGVFTDLNPNMRKREF